jgi:hypothetical protein
MGDTKKILLVVVALMCWDASLNLQFPISSYLICEIIVSKINIFNLYEHFDILKFD